MLIWGRVDFILSGDADSFGRTVPQIFPQASWDLFDAHSNVKQIESTVRAIRVLKKDKATRCLSLVAIWERGNSSHWFSLWISRKPNRNLSEPNEPPVTETQLELSDRYRASERSIKIKDSGR